VFITEDLEVSMIFLYRNRLLIKTGIPEKKNLECKLSTMDWCAVQ